MFSPSEGKLIADRYLLEREIARGGMGTVWRAFDQQLSAPCALKFILQAFATHEELRARFVREARAIAAIQSPHLVAIRGVGECEDSLYIAMELMEGETLQQYLDREGKLSPEQTALMMDQVSSVLSKAHSLGIVHRDLKPENLWLWEDGPFFIKVLDFGVAKHVFEGDIMRTATGALVGTPHYMSPEQAEGSKTVDHRADIWSLAVIAVECLAGTPPFDGTSLAELLIKIARTDPPPIATAAPGFLRLEKWWAKATARADQRHNSIRELAKEFRAALNSPEPVAAVAGKPYLGHAATEMVRIEPGALRPTLDSVSKRDVSNRDVSNRAVSKDSASSQRSSTTAPFTKPHGDTAAPRTNATTPHLDPTQELAAVDAATLQTLVPPPLSWKPAVAVGALMALLGTGYFVWNRSQAANASTEPTAASAASHELSGQVLHPSAVASAVVIPVAGPQHVNYEEQPVPSVSSPATTTGIAPKNVAPALNQVIRAEAQRQQVVVADVKAKPAAPSPPAPKLANSSPVPNKSPSGSAPPNERSRRRPSADVDQRLGF